MTTDTRPPPTDPEIAALRSEFGITSNGRGIKEFTQVRDFARAVLAKWGAQPVARKQDDALIRQLVETLEDFDDEGPLGEGWKSDRLLSLLTSARAALEGK